MIGAGATVAPLSLYGMERRAASVERLHDHQSTDSFEEIMSRIQNCGIVNTHAHHLTDAETKGLTIARIFQRSYVSWCGEPIPSSSATVDKWIDKVGNRSFYVSLSHALQMLYSMDKPISGATWDEYNLRIQKAHENPNRHMELLQKQCRYNAVVQDAYWEPGSNNGHPEIFKPTFRISSFLWGYNREARDHNGNNAQLTYGQNIDDIKTYTDFIFRIIKKKKEAGCSSLKSSIAYDRTIEIGAATAEEAQAAMWLGRSEPPAALIRSFQDYTFNVICEIAADLKIPVQIHTGLGLMTGANPMQLQSLIARHPKTTFVLMHGGYPWLDDICGLVHVYPNVIVDLCWLPLISPSATVRFLHELFEVCNADKIVWGCDTWTSEESWGALRSVVKVLATVLDEKVSAGYLSKNNALQLAENIMCNNAKRWFCL
jgi:predicted TIM-barrel fold metal-dependent hydrolase